MTHRGPFQPLPFCDSVILFNPSTALLSTASPTSPYIDKAEAALPAGPAHGASWADAESIRET